MLNEVCFVVPEAATRSAGIRMPKNIPSSWMLYVLMLGRRGYRRGGRNLSERPSHPARTMPRSQPSSSSSSSWVDDKVSKLSSPALTSPSTFSAAARISRDGEEYITFHGVKIPKKPPPPAADGMYFSPPPPVFSSPINLPIILNFLAKIKLGIECWYAGALS
jgi:hypothetical protein